MTSLLTLPALAQSSAGLVGLISTAAGLRCIVAPHPFSQSFGLPQSQKASSENAFITVVGSRNIAMGLSILGLSYQGNTLAVGTVLLCGLASTIGDSLITWKKGVTEATTHHVAACLVVGLLGSYLTFVV